MTHKYDYLVIGSGLAGLAFSLKMAELRPDCKIAVLCKFELETGNTELAQGGIAAVMAEDDSFDRHVQDTLAAGAGLCRPEVVHSIVEQGPDRIKDLINWGIQFDQNPSKERFALTREGGHSKRRILHVEDHTGADIHKQLLKIARSTHQIYFLENFIALDLITLHTIHPSKACPNKCLGAYVLNKNSQSISPILAKETLLATGGAGKVYLYTSNWSGATGDGIAMAFRAGARVSNMEFMQFHPTCLFHPESRNFLISEALRGEGAELVNKKGEAFMGASHPLGSLAPRDIVARFIDAEIKKSGADCVYLDITHQDPTFLENRFPLIFKRCMDLGVDIRKDLIPVVPAAHYLCGGVLCDPSAGTDLPGLSVLGETACTGLHGANRLASNSLLECLALSNNAATRLDKMTLSDVSDEKIIPPYPQQHQQNSDELIVVTHMWEEIRRLMWNYMGIVRSNRRLRRAETRLNYISQEIKDYYSNSKIHADIVELRNLALVAELSVKCALSRSESRGIHYNLDFPPPTHPSSLGTDSILNPPAREL